MAGESQKYDIDALRQRIPEDRSEFFLGFVPWQEDSEGWTHATRELLREGTSRPLLRTVWDSPTTPGARVLIDALECSSAADAMQALVDRLVNNQLDEVPPGPSGLGEVSFAHPAGVPPAIFFVRGNLCISVISFGRTAVAVRPWADRLAARLEQRPALENLSFSLAAEPPAAAGGRRIAVRFSRPKKLDEDGYVKFFVSGAAVAGLEGAQGESRLILAPKSPTEVLVEAFVVEPGRQSYGGRLTVKVA